jgi:DNA mismatch repair protein MutS2
VQLSYGVETLIQQETLELLEWERLCEHLSSFANTKLGAIASRYLTIPEHRELSAQLLAQTQEVCYLENTSFMSLSFEGIEDIGDSLERAELQGILTGKELLAIATTLAGVRRLRRLIDEQENLPVLNTLVAEVRTYPELEQEIHHCIDDRGDVADRASAKLTEIRIQLKAIRDKIYQSLQSIITRKSNAVQEGVITQRGDRFVIPVKSSHKDSIPGIVHDVSASGLTLYIEPNSIVQLGNNLRQKQRQEQAEVEIILRNLSEKIAEVKSDLEHLLAVATSLDLATARSRYSTWLEANPPRFIDRDQETITLRKLKHPLLVWQHKHEQGNEVIPIDLMIQNHIKVVTITGPNTGGKTVTLKTLALAALMAKVGLFIPAKEPVEIPWFDHILADIGDEQSLQQSLSTFSGHIRRISRILGVIDNNPTELTTEQPRSLILLDEVGAGTDPAEGSALAIAILQYLATQADLTIATTHYGELKALKYQDQRFENASVEFNDQTLSPTYRLLWGIPGRSNALSIAKRLGLNNEIINNAQKFVGDENADINEVIAGMEAQRRTQETKAEATGKLLQETERLYQELLQKTAALEAREKDLKLAQELEVQTAISKAKTEIAQVIKELQQGGTTGQKAQKATSEIGQIADKYIPEKIVKKPKNWQPKIGDRVKIPKLGQTAEILNIEEEHEEIIVRFGLMKMTVKITDIESLQGEKITPVAKQKTTTHQKQPAQSTLSVPTVRTSQNTIDLRGSKVADAEIELDRFIGQTNIGSVWIIHGKGTGKLREGIHEFLKRHPQITHFEIAKEADGGTGVTIAYLD